MSILTDNQISSVDMESRRAIALGSGDVVRVWQKLVEKGKTRLQAFEGVIIATKHGTEPGATFTVRRVGSDGVVVEKIFPLYSPMIDRVEVLKRTRMRRAKLYFLRHKTPRQVREKLRRSAQVSESTVSESERARQQVEVDQVVEDKSMEETQVKDEDNAEVAVDEKSEGEEKQKQEEEKPAENKTEEVADDNKTSEEEKEKEA